MPFVSKLLLIKIHKKAFCDTRANFDYSLEVGHLN